MARSMPRNLELSATQRRAFGLAERAARKAVRRRFRVIRLTQVAYLKLGRHENALTRVARDIGSLMRLARAWAAREYRDVPWRSVVFVVAAIVYFVNPADLVPDVLAGIGFVDDAAVITAVVRSIADDLSAFRAWERRRDGDSTVRELFPRTSAAA